MEIQTDHNRDLFILEQIEKNPDASQATLASQLGVAVSVINWHLKRLIAKGYVKVRRMESRKFQYIITPEGLALRAHLTIDFIRSSFQLYRLVRQRMNEVLSQVHQAGYHDIRLVGDGDVAEICRLTCLENNIAVVSDPEAPCVQIKGYKMFLSFKNEGPNPENGTGLVSG
jgi:DNA-binding MarR family transcriptional regulator